MKITKSQLKQIIKEELEKLDEVGEPLDLSPGRFPPDPYELTGDPWEYMDAFIEKYPDLKEITMADFKSYYDWAYGMSQRIASKPAELAKLGFDSKPSNAEELRSFIMALMAQKAQNPNENHPKGYF